MPTRTDQHTLGWLKNVHWPYVLADLSNRRTGTSALHARFRRFWRADGDVRRELRQSRYVLTSEPFEPGLPVHQGPSRSPSNFQTSRRPSSSFPLLSVVFLIVFTVLASRGGSITVEKDTTILNLDLHQWVFPDPSRTDTASRADVAVAREFVRRFPDV